MKVSDKPDYFCFDCVYYNVAITLYSRRGLCLHVAPLRPFGQRTLLMMKSVTRRLYTLILKSSDHAVRARSLQINYNIISKWPHPGGCRRTINSSLSLELEVVLYSSHASHHHIHLVRFTSL